MELEGIEEFQESEVRIIGDKVELTREDFDKLNENLEIAQLQLQEANDTLNGGITARNMASFRNTYVINASDSLDDSYPMYVYFRILDETVKIVSVKVSYWIHKYRAYSKAATEKEAVTSGASSAVSSASGGVVTSAAGGVVSSASGGGETPTSSSPNVDHRHDVPVFSDAGGVAVSYLNNQFVKSTAGTVNVPTSINSATHTHTVTIAAHTHTGGSHTHTGGTHTHDIPHTHTVPAHSHGITYGIYEENNTPIVKFSVSQDGGVAYGKEYGNTIINQELLDITSNITKTGSKVLKFESTTRTRLTVQIEVKVDISVR